jgi:hypothetical protein
MMDDSCMASAAFVYLLPFGDVRGSSQLGATAQVNLQLAS